MPVMTKQQGWIAIAVLVVLAAIGAYIVWKLNKPDHPWTDDLDLGLPVTARLRGYLPGL